tara:strand:- start:1637 stop:1789 length:153 start_codon:yes stop_codon:yes gene_type:complete
MKNKNHCYKSVYSMFNVEIIKLYNEKEGKNQLIYLYCDKKNHKPTKYRIV